MDTTQKMLLVDTLLGTQLPNSSNAILKLKTISALDTISVTFKRSRILREITQKDPTLVALHTYIKAGWSAEKSGMENNQTFFFQYKDASWTHDGLLSGKTVLLSHKDYADTSYSKSQLTLANEHTATLIETSLLYYLTICKRRTT